MRISSIVALAALLAGGGAARGAVTFSFEAPKAQSTTAKVHIAGMDTFDTGATASSIGTYSSDYSIQPADDYGGAYGTNYIRTGTTFTLTLNQPASYFGLWISALDAGNSLALFSGETQVGSFSYGDVPAAFSHYGSDYAYNPQHQHRLQSGILLREFPRLGRHVRQDRVHAERHEQRLFLRWTTSPPAPVPEPASWAMMILGVGLLGGGLRVTRSRRPLAA